MIQTAFIVTAKLKLSAAFNFWASDKNYDVVIMQ